MFTLAGEVAVDPGPLTLRELLVMAKASWSKVAKLEAAIRDHGTPRKDKQFWNPKFFNPYEQVQKRSLTAQDLHGLKGLASRVTVVKLSEIKVADAD